MRAISSTPTWRPRRRSDRPTSDNRCIVGHARFRLTVALIMSIGIVAGAALVAADTASAYGIWAVAGNGQACSTPPSCGAGVAATRGQLSFPEGVAVGPSGEVYIADWGDNQIRKVALDGTISAVAGDGTACFSAPRCGDGAVAISAQLSFPEGVAVGSDGSVYIADTGDNEIRKLAPNGTITRFAGTGQDCSRPPACGDGGAATSAQLSAPAGIAIDRTGDVYIADAGDSEVRKVSPSGKITRIAGTGVPCATAAACGDNGLATGAELNFPGGVAVGPGGEVYIADAGDNEVRKVSTTGAITLVAGDGTLCSAPATCGDGGAATSAQLSGPDGVAIGPDESVYIADAGDNELRRVSPAGKITTIAGNGSSCSMPSSCGDGGVASAAQLNYPDGVAVDPSGNLYIADTYDHELRWLSAATVSMLRVPSGRVALAAFAAEVSPKTVTARYALSAPAALTLSVTPANHSTAIVGHAAGQSGFGALTWNRRLGGARAPRGHYTLTITATVGGHSASSKLELRLT